MATEKTHKKTHIHRRADALADAVADLPDDRLLTPDELAAWLGVHVMTLKRWRRENMGPAYSTLGHKKLRYRKGDVVEWLESQKIRAGEEASV